MRVLWGSNAPWAATGYGNQTALFGKRIAAAGHDVALVAWYGLQGGCLTWEGLRVYPQWMRGFGDDALEPHGRNWNADVAIQLTDLWVQKSELLPTIRFVPWFPVDHEPVPGLVVSRASESWQPIVFSKFGQKEMENAGVRVMYVPHGVDTSVYRPMPRAEAREMLNLPKDRFIAVMVAANKGFPARKSFPEVIQAWAKFRRRRPDSMLYLHTLFGTEMNGIAFVELLRAEGLRQGLDGDVCFADQYHLVTGFPPEYMRAVYSAADVLLSPSMGEGFGIPIVEAQACGTPVIVGDWTAMPELCFAGWRIARERAHRTWTPLCSWQYTPSVLSIVEALNSAYLDKGNELTARRAREGVMPYDADRVMEEHWKPALAEMASRVERENETAADVASTPQAG